MANELTVSGSMSFAKVGVTYPSGSTNYNSIGDAFSNLQFTVTGTNYVADVVSAATSATVVPLGSVTQPHWSIWLNLDATNYVQLQNGASGAVVGRLYPGEPALLPLDIACVPYLVAHTAACLVKYLIVSL